MKTVQLNSTLAMSHGAFQSDYYFSAKAGYADDKEYVLHLIMVCNTITIAGQAFDAVYETARSLVDNNLGLPSPELELCRDGDTHELLSTIDMFTLSELKELDPDDLGMLFQIAQEECPDIRNLADIMAVHHAILDNQTLARTYFKGLGLSDNLDDYIEVRGEFEEMRLQRKD